MNNIIISLLHNPEILFYSIISGVIFLGILLTPKGARFGLFLITAGISAVLFKQQREINALRKQVMYEKPLEPSHDWDEIISRLK